MSSSDSLLVATRVTELLLSLTTRLRQLDWTPLHAAAICSAVDSTTVMELLLSAVAAVDARDGVRGGCKG
jgi:hypothetical protein